MPLDYGREVTLSEPEATFVQPLATLLQQEATIGCRLPVYNTEEPLIRKQSARLGLGLARRQINESR